MSMRIVESHDFECIGIFDGEDLLTSLPKNEVKELYEVLGEYFRQYFLENSLLKETSATGMMVAGDYSDRTMKLLFSEDEWKKIEKKMCDFYKIEQVK